MAASSVLQGDVVQDLYPKLISSETTASYFSQSENTVLNATCIMIYDTAASRFVPLAKIFAKLIGDSVLVRKDTRTACNCLSCGRRVFIISRMKGYLTCGVVFLVLCTAIFVTACANDSAWGASYGGAGLQQDGRPSVFTGETPRDLAVFPTFTRVHFNCNQNSFNVSVPP